MNRERLASELLRLARDLVAVSFSVGDKVEISASEKEYDGETGKIYFVLTGKLKGYYQVLLTSGPKRQKIMVFDDKHLVKAGRG